MTLTWIDHTIWWHVYPLGFTGAPMRPRDDERALTHRLRHLIGWLDYAVDLGTNGLALGPVFTSKSHGYDTHDFFSIDPRLGDEQDLDDLIAAAKARGMHVLLDGVFNHVGAGHPLFQAALAGGPDCPQARLFRIDWSAGTPSYGDFEGHRDLVALNHDDPAVADLVTEVMLHWLRRGIAGWRLDAAYAVPAHFWTQVLPRVRAEFPDAWFVGEVLHGDHGQLVRESGMDATTAYELWKATWSSLHDDNFFELDWCLRRHDEMLAQFTPLTFVGNHDVTRLASQVDDARAALAQVVLFTVGGVPAVYYGDEQAFRGVKTVGWHGDDAVRPPYPVTPAELAPAGAWMYRLIQQLIGLRRRHPWLVHARTETVSLETNHYRYDAVGPAGQRLHVELDLRGTPRARISDDRQTLFSYPQ